MKGILKKYKDKIYKFKEYFLLFFICSNLGWIMEVIIFLFKEHRFINRGFLIGPYCSIYGFGCVLIIIALKKYRKKPIKLFFISMIMCTVIEYLTSYAMEVIFNARWWTYSGNILNINGRVWFATTILFGVLACVIIYFLRPLLLKIMRKIPNKIVNTVTLVLLCIYLADNIVTFKLLYDIKGSMSSFSEDCTSEVSSKIMNILMGKN